MDSFTRRTKHRFGKMINSAVAVINQSTLRRRSNFSRSATTNSYGPVPIDGDSSVPLMYTSQRSNSTTSSTNSIGSLPGYGGVSNLIKVKSLEQSFENDLHISNDQPNEPRPAPIISSALSILNGFIRITEFMYVTDNKDLLEGDRLDSAGVSHVISLGDDLPSVVAATKKDGLLVMVPLTLHREADVNPDQDFNTLIRKFDVLNLFIENARKLFQKIVIYSKQKTLAYFVAAQYNIDYYQLEVAKAMSHLQKVTGAEWVDLPQNCSDKLASWRNVGKQRREKQGVTDSRQLSISVNSSLRSA